MKTFLTVCETMNYREAAEKLFITQPAVSQQIRYLENYYGCRLFTYDGKKLLMTKEARILQRSAVSIEYQENRLAESLKKQSDTLTLSIGVTKTIAEFVICEHVMQYLKDPGNQLNLEVDNTDAIFRKLDAGKLDFAVIEGFFNSAQYGSRLYQKEPYLGLCSRENPLAGRTVPMDEIFSQDLLLREEGSGTRRIFETILHEHNHTIADFPHVTCIGDVTLLEHLLAHDLGISFGYRAIAEASFSRLATFSVEGWEVSREFNYIFLKDAGIEELVDRFDPYRR